MPSNPCCHVIRILDYPRLVSFRSEDAQTQDGIHCAFPSFTARSSSLPYLHNETIILKSPFEGESIYIYRRE